MSSATAGAGRSLSFLPPEKRRPGQGADFLALDPDAIKSELTQLHEVEIRPQLEANLVSMNTRRAAPLGVLFVAIARQRQIKAAGSRHASQRSAEALQVHVPQVVIQAPIKNEREGRSELGEVKRIPFEELHLEPSFPCLGSSVLERDRRGID